ncbi:carbohydrate esterase family 16 protein [Macrolepiota fuliginosa MF-IS2]|uniref:Carbohydrate esterase family 16 protein n=1 Tax=Macrolepiota fuliginosa MF-IS2 TaxID=1400762 RepID=A0A9P5XJM2_9AGAR|nr:carbohydrate esterase family 16 protein [Macrolepiota fuliginosa MF-IS2]
MKFTALTALHSLLPLARANGPFTHGQIKTLVTFGDSTTDTQRVFNGGVQWPDYVSGYANVTLYPFAQSGSTCSNAITPRPFPALVESQLPTFFEEKKNGTVKLEEKSTVYTLWMGTNDIGVNSILTQGNEATIVDVASCLTGWVKTMYDSGARNLILQNLFPLEKTPIYSIDSWPAFYWHLPRNATEFHYDMKNYVDTLNTMTKLMVQDLVPSLPGAHVGIFDTHSMFNDVIANPSKYLNGTAPLNTTGCIKACVYEVGTEINTCTFYANGTDRDSFVWWDELHASEQADRNIAKQISNIITGVGSPWINWLS